MECKKVGSLGIELQYAGRHTEAIRAYDTAIAIAEKCGAELDGVDRMVTEINARVHRAQVLWKLGRIQELEEACRAALPVVVRLIKDNPRNVYVPYFATRQGELLIFQGLSRADAGKSEQAAAEIRQAFRVIRGLKPKDRQKLRFADVWTSLDQAVQWIDKHKPADDHLRRIRAEATKVLGLRDK
jgi:hypothetical protein